MLSKGHRAGVALFTCFRINNVTLVQHGTSTGLRQVQKQY